MKKGSPGMAAAWFVLFLPVMLLFLGLIFDVGFLLWQSQRLNAATDAAARAAASAWDRDYWLWHGQARIDPLGAEGLARDYLAKNTPSARLTQVTVNPPNRVNIRTETTVPFFFMGIFGWHETTVESFSTATCRNVH